jgi:ribosome-associated translation inhibitor RaiA
MAKLTFSNFEILNDQEQEYARKQINSFLEKAGSILNDIDSFDVSLVERRRRSGTFGLAEFNLKMICNYGVFQSTAADWDKSKALKRSLAKLEKQLRKRR